MNSIDGARTGPALGEEMAVPAAMTAETANVLRHFYLRLQALDPGDNASRYRLCYHAARALMPVDTFYVGLYQSGNRLLMPFIVQDSRFVGADVQTYGPHGMSAWICASRKTYLWKQDGGRMVTRTSPDDDSTRDALITPLLATRDDAVIGLMGLISSSSGAYAERSIALVEWIGRALVLSLESRDAGVELLGLSALFPELAGESYEDTGAVMDSLQVRLATLRSLLNELHGVAGLPATAIALTQKALLVSDDIENFVIKVANEQGTTSDTLHGLSEREREVAMLIRDRRMSNADLANALGISESTVKKHVSSVLRKLGIAQREEIARLDT